MLCLPIRAAHRMWSVCRDASHPWHLTASFDSFVSRLVGHSIQAVRRLAAARAVDLLHVPRTPAWRECEQPDADKQHWDDQVASLLDETGDEAVRTSQAFDNAALSVTC